MEKIDDRIENPKNLFPNIESLFHLIVGPKLG